MNILFYFIGIIVIQRFTELLIAKRNTKISFYAGGYEVDRKGYLPIIFMHILFFISLITEFIICSRALSPYWIFFLTIFLAAQLLRYWSIYSLGRQWNTRIIIVPGSGLVKTGPYRYFNHPNYIAVITEIAVIPLIFECYFTSIIFSFLNAIVLYRRIKIENNAILNLNK